MIPDSAFNLTALAITDLLEMYEIDIDNDDVQQNITNCAVTVDNYYHGYDDNGNKTLV